jgi:hypothetical protein
MRPSALVAVAMASALAGCVTIPAPPSAVLEYARQDCGDRADLASATSLVPERERASHTVSVNVTAQTACLAEAERTSPYVVFAVPPDGAGKTIQVGATLEAARIFSPRIAVLDAEGVVTRTFERDQFLYRGPIYSVQLRPRPNEAFVLVTADPALVGQRYDSINISTATGGAYAAGVYASWTTGVDQAQSRTFSYEGTVVVTVYSPETAEAR